MNIEFKEMRCESCGQLGVAAELLGVALCSRCANAAKTERERVEAAVANALIDFLSKLVNNVQDTKHG